ncbi:transglycosylase domain-containing protein [Selenomonas sp.]|uniref:transglycosylase domain-containing protein n=1 Tax=Selenomonas sp. TaxID=2053611 RepID=UPI0025E1D129|nr:penicillin-binding protein 1A [Selenomonas sp.]MCI6283644.1 penicillin-binding protein 1A [Selenomonas sp.]
MEKRSQRSHQQQRNPKKGGNTAKHKTLIGIAIVFLVMLTGIGCGFLTASMNTKSDLADDIRPPASSLVYDSDGNEIATIHAAENRMPVKLDQVPQNLQDAFVAVEDNRFYDHIGVDPRGIARAIWANLRGRTVSEGGSTITQQLAKNAYLTQDRTLKRKIQEVFLALRLEHQYTKSEILELYLNQIYFGQGAYGVQAAARTYFGKDVEDLTLNECAMLAGIPKSPNYYSPLNNLQAAQERKATVLDQMVKYGYLDSATAEKTKQEKPDLVKPDPAKDDKGEASYFVDYVTQKLIDKYGADAVYKDGLQVYTTIDMDMQRAAEKAMKGLPSGRKDANGVVQPQGALVALDPHTGYVKAMVGGRGTDQFNRATMAERQPGSAFKPFVFAAALENKFSPSTVINDSPIKIGDWEPQNDEHTFSGPVTMRQVAQHSMNVPTVKIAQKLGIEKVLYYAQEMGISTLVMDGPHNDKNLASALGGLTKGVTPLELTSAYGTFANKGVHVDPVVIVKVLDRNGKVIDEANPEQHNVISESSAADLTSMLQDVIRAGTGRRASIGRPAAGKTGTTSDYHDAWFVGYTPDLVASVWIGNDDNTSLGGIYGGTVPATIWKDFMTEALKGTPAKDFDGSESSGGDSIGSLEDDKSTAVTKKSAAPAKKEEKPAEKKSKDEGKKQPGQQPAAPQGQAPASAPASAGGGGGAAPEPGSSVSKGRN